MKTRKIQNGIIFVHSHTWTYIAIREGDEELKTETCNWIKQHYTTGTIPKQTMAVGKRPDLRIK